MINREEKGHWNQIDTKSILLFIEGLTKKTRIGIQALPKVRYISYITIPVPTIRDILFFLLFALKGIFMSLTKDGQKNLVK